MNIIFVFLTILATSLALPKHSQENTETLRKAELSEAEQQLFALINQYRDDSGLDTVAFSTQLTEVAQAHVRDLAINKPYDENGKCNPHSWSAEGSWKACCYSDGRIDGACMWNKPRELTTYPGDGFEIVVYSFDSSQPNADIEPALALGLWLKSENHRNVILNKGIWEDTIWKAMGVGIYEGYAAVWFGRE